MAFKFPVRLSSRPFVARGGEDLARTLFIIATSQKRRDALQPQRQPYKPWLPSRFSLYLFQKNISTRSYMILKCTRLRRHLYPTMGIHSLPLQKLTYPKLSSSYSAFNPLNICKRSHPKICTSVHLYRDIPHILWLRVTALLPLSARMLQVPQLDRTTHT